MPEGGSRAGIIHAGEVRDENKYERMLICGLALPSIREKIEEDLSASGMPRQKVLATVLRLMETTYIRVGNEEYARTNHSYGLTTMRNRHVQVEGSTVTFKFQGKSGVRHTVDINDRRLAKIIRRWQDIPGYELFQYVDSEGEPHTIDSADGNDYLREISSQDFTAKDFRTWAGTLLACVNLCEFEAFELNTQARKNIVQAIKAVAQRLGNTPSVCRKCYGHPAVLECSITGAMARLFRGQVRHKSADLPYALQREEEVLMRLLRNGHKK
jgi:DNA topoisomerase-1